MISIFTPTHNPQYLDECLESLLAQTYKNWEWIVVFNGKAAEDGHGWLRQAPDERIRVVVAGDDTSGVGAVKREACSLANGEYLVELDHDDLLLPDALKSIKKAFDTHQNAVFVYSDYAQIDADGTPNKMEFHEKFGWQYLYEEHDGKQYSRCKALHHFPSAVSLIWFAPNHVRAFRKDVYDAVGGYNPTLDILDDQELMGRLYRAGDFYHIDKLLYLQRVHDDNTQKDPVLNARIQEETVQQYDQNIEQNALAWARRNKLHTLDLGGAHNAPPGYLTVDLHDADLVGDVFDILDQLPENSVGVIRAVDFLEHIEDKVRLFNSMYRVLAHGGMVLSMTPSTDGRGAFQDPTHVSFYNENSFWYYSDKELAKFVPEVKCRFQATRLYTNYPSEWHERVNICYVYAHLTAVKNGARIAGELRI